MGAVEEGGDDDVTVTEQAVDSEENLDDEEMDYDVPVGLDATGTAVVFASGREVRASRPGEERPLPEVEGFRSPEPGEFEASSDGSALEFDVVENFADENATPLKPLPIMVGGEKVDFYSVTQDMFNQMDEEEMDMYDEMWYSMYNDDGIGAKIDTNLKNNLRNASKQQEERAAKAAQEAADAAAMTSVRRDSHRGSHRKPSGGHNSAERAKYGAKCILMPSDAVRKDIYDSLKATRDHKKNGRSEMPMPTKTWPYLYPADERGIRKPDKRLLHFVRNNAKNGQRGIRLSVPTNYDPVNQVNGAMVIRQPSHLDTFLDRNYFKEHQKVPYPLLEAVTLMRKDALLKAKLQDAAEKRQATRRLGASRPRR